MASEDALADLDALLSDLERTQCELYEEEVLESSSTAASASTATSNSTFDACIQQQKQLHNHRPIVVHGSAPSSPTTTVNSAQKTPGHPIPSRHQKSARGEEALLGNTYTTTAVVDQEYLEGSNMSAVANPVKQNINELDSLLQDLSNAR